jgi:hypothetical protein
MPVPIGEIVPGLDACGATSITLPSRTLPNKDNKPVFIVAGDDGPPARSTELRRHVYRRAGIAVRIKVKWQSTEGARWTNWYRVCGPDGISGWQAKRPPKYDDVPFISLRGANSFDPELVGDMIFWTEGEKDADTLAHHDLLAFTFGGAGDGSPEASAHHLTGRHTVIVTDNDAAGIRSGEKRAALAYAAGSASIRIVGFPELPLGGDLTDFFESGGTAEYLMQRAATASQWEPPHVASHQLGADQAYGSPVRELVICRASEVEPEQISWVWPGRIAAGKQTLIAGEPGLGKSQLSTAIVASVTTGDRWPHDEGQAPHGSVIILSAEDGMADTIIPRLMAAGADRERVYIVSAVRKEDGTGNRSFNLHADLKLLEQNIEAIGDVRLIVIDPISSYMGAIDSHKNTDVRGVLEVVGEMATRYRVAVLGITHFSKGAGQKAINAFIGSIAFIAAARAAFAVMKDPDDESRRLFLPVKNNLAPMGHGLAFRLVQHFVSTKNGETLASAIAWESEYVASKADEVMAANAGGEDTRQSAKQDAEEFLRSVLAAGPVSVTELEADAKAAGLLGDKQAISQSKPFRSARDTLGIKPRKSGFQADARWVWELPEAPKMPSDP